MATMQAAHPEKNIHEEVSNYYLAEDMATTFNAMNLVVEDEDWPPFVTCSTVEFAIFMIEMAKNIRLKKFKKHKRGIKNTSSKNQYKGKPHVSTERLLS